MGSRRRAIRYVPLSFVPTTLIVMTYRATIKQSNISLPAEGSFRQCERSSCACWRWLPVTAFQPRHLGR